MAVSVIWDPPAGTGPDGYEATYAGVPVIADCTIYCTDQELRTVTVTKPAAGSSAVLSVAVRDGRFNLSVPAQLTIAG